MGKELAWLAAVGGCRWPCGCRRKSRWGYALFAHAYLVAFTFYLSIALGALFFVMLHHISRAGWSVTLRRLAEALSANLFLLAPLALLLAPAIFGLYEWAVPESVGRRLLGDKATYLTPPWFMLRLAGYFAVWVFLAWYFRSRSIRQDADGEVKWSRRMERMSVPGMIALGLSMTLAAVDLLMSLNPHWCSTIIGVYFFAGSALAGLVVLTLLAVWLQAAGKLKDAITTEHYHDLGKLTFAFVVFWGYIAFSQYMLTWYANMPGETQFYMPRQIGPWAGVSLALLFCQLLIPMFGLLSRHAKRHPMVFTFWAVWLLGAHLLDLYWLIMPDVFIRQIPQAVGALPGTPLPEALKQLLASDQSVYQVSQQHQAFMQLVTAPLTPAAVGMVLGLVVGLGGMFVAATLWFCNVPRWRPSGTRGCLNR